jgi:NAD(P)-dependent dehydrogenase (short-subunit alcohol dehydrogenase family)
MSTFSGKVALVTGGGSGIGRATAIAFAKAGAKVVVAGRREAQGAQVAQEVGGLFVRADVSREADIVNLLQRVMSAYNRLDFAFNNAGTEGAGKPVAEESEANYQTVFDTNVKGSLLSMKHEIPHILASGGGAIVNISSIVGMIGFPGASVYTASKHAVEGLTKCAALEHARAGLRINVVAPGAVVTDMFDRFTGHNRDMQAGFANMHPMGRAAQPEEVARAVLFLCSDGASFMTGQTLHLDGGFTIQ